MIKNKPEFIQLKRNKDKEAGLAKSCKQCNLRK